MKIDTVNNSHCFVRNSIEWDHRSTWGWCDAILGIDGCIYWPPCDTGYTLKYDPHSNQTSLVGHDFSSEGYKWCGGALATDGVIYCIPSSAKQVLAIDPLAEFSDATKTKMEEHPEELGFLFQINDGSDSAGTRTVTASNQTHFDCAVTKFGMQ